MRNTLRHCALCYSSGVVGGLAKGVLVWACMRSAVTAPFGEQLAAALHVEGLYTRLVWSGLFALVFVLPFARGAMLPRALLGALIVSVVQLLVLPLVLHSSFHLLALSTLSLVLLNCIWGLAAVAMLHSIE